MIQTLTSVSANCQLTGFPLQFGDGKLGIISRNEIGFLMWRTSKEATEKYALGSRYKTPVLPLWLTCINDNWGVLFNPNRDLMKSYSAENRFQLHYYSNCVVKEVLKEKRDTILTIDTRGNNPKDKNNFGDGDLDFEDGEEECDLLELAVQTKWEGANLDWQGIPRHV